MNVKNIRKYRTAQNTYFLSVYEREEVDNKGIFLTDITTPSIKHVPSIPHVPEQEHHM